MWIVDRSKILILASLLMLLWMIFPQSAQAGKAMKALAFDGASGTVEVAAIYETSYAAQKGVMKSLKPSSKLMKKALGFKGTIILRSQDGKQVITLSQWQDLASYQAYTSVAVADSSTAASAPVPPAPTHTFTFEVAATQTSINGATPALRGKEAVVQVAQFTAKQPDSQSQLLAQVQEMIPALLQKQPIPQSVVLLKKLDSGDVALLTNWNCSALFEDVGKPAAIKPSNALIAIADIEQQLYNVVNIIPAELQKAGDQENKFDN